MAEQTSTNASDGIYEIISIVVQALLLAVLVRTLLFQPFSIPSGSMKPTLLVGDYLFVNKYSYGYSKYSIPLALNLFSGRIWEGTPKLGEIAVFRKPNETDIDYIKRVIGLPGDKIQVIEGILHINGTPVKRERKGTYNDDESFRNSEVPIYVETLPNGVTYETLDLSPRSEGDNTKVFEVPKGHYFMMGDNRDNSLDSRFDVGFVPLENFIGPATMVFFSVKNGAHPLAFWKWPADMRFNRLLKGL